MTYKRKDKGCTSKVLAVVGDRVLLEARWGKHVNTCFVDASYFRAKYGAEPSAV